MLTREQIITLSSFGEGLARASHRCKLNHEATIAVGVLLTAVEHPEWAAAWAKLLKEADEEFGQFAKCAATFSELMPFEVVQ